jgi:hypothetical protein
MDLNVAATLVSGVTRKWRDRGVVRGFRRVPTSEAVPRTTCPVDLHVISSVFWFAIFLAIVLESSIHGGMVMMTLEN